MTPSPPQNISLEPLTRDHARELFDALQDPAIYAHIDDAPPEDFERYAHRCWLLENTLAPNGQDRWLNWVVRVDSDVAGYVQATVYPARVDRPICAEIAYVINSHFHGRGIGSRATEAMMTLLSQEFSVAQMWVTVRDTNTASIALAKKLGFVEVNPETYPFDNFAPDDIVLLRG